MAEAAPRRVLLVDDDITMLDAHARMVEQCGYVPLQASTWSDALRMFRTSSPDIVLLDVMMPGDDGYSVCSQLKKKSATQNIPVIFMSALDDTDSKVKGFSAGAVDYVTKPLQREEVLARVDTHLTLRRQQQELETKNRQLRDQIAQRKKAEQALQ